jgi:hypothetical protein
LLLDQSDISLFLLGVVLEKIDYALSCGFAHPAFGAGNFMQSGFQLQGE